MSAVCCNLLQCVAVCCSENLQGDFWWYKQICITQGMRPCPLLGCGVLQWVAVCCNLCQCVASSIYEAISWVMQTHSHHTRNETMFLAQVGCVAVCWSVLQCVLQCNVLMTQTHLHYARNRTMAFPWIWRIGVCCNVLQRVAVCCSALQCVAASTT